MKKYEHFVYSAIGLVALLLLLVAVNFLISRVPARVDLTEGDIYTLSPGTRKILQNLQAPVKSCCGSMPSSCAASSSSESGLGL